MTEKEKKFPTADAPQAAPESVKAPGTGEDEGRQTSAATLPEDRVPGVQYPPSSNQLSEEDIEALQNTPARKAEQEQADNIRKLNEDSADVLAAAGSSGDAGVQNLLARRAIAEQNGDEAGIKQIDAKLADLVG